MTATQYIQQAQAFTKCGHVAHGAACKFLAGVLNLRDTERVIAASGVVLDGPVEAFIAKVDAIATWKVSVGA